MPTGLPSIWSERLETGENMIISHRPKSAAEIENAMLLMPSHGRAVKSQQLN
jgi:hypothetical protein